MLSEFTEEEQQQNSVQITQLDVTRGVGWSRGLRVHEMAEVC